MADTQSGSAAFIDAIKAGEFERVKAMVSSDPRLLDARGRTGDSAILTAVYHRQKEIVNLLVARGATLTLHEACAAGEFERVERLLAAEPDTVNTFSPDGWTPLHLAAFFGYPKIVELLLAHDADVIAHSRNPTGNTPRRRRLQSRRADGAVARAGEEPPRGGRDAAPPRRVAQSSTVNSASVKGSQLTADCQPSTLACRLSTTSFRLSPSQS
jgi:ankyrin repeat protein